MTHLSINAKLKQKSGGDSGFVVPELYKIAEQLDILYAIRLKVNSTLYRLAAEFAQKMSKLCKFDLISSHVIYGEFKYKASSCIKRITGIH